MSNEKKKRSNWVSGIVDPADGVVEVTYNLGDDSFEIVGAEAGSVKLMRTYERESGKEKVVFEADAVGGGVPADALATLVSRYDYLAAVDTNTRIVNGRSVAVSFAYYVPGELSSFGKAIPFHPMFGFVMLDVSSKINPETLGWHLFLSTLRPLNGKSNALVVDSELGKLPKINRRDEPYYDEHFLPNGTTLIYSSDATAEFLTNQMIRHCHNVATRAADELGTRIPEIEAICLGGDQWHSGHLRFSANPKSPIQNK